MATDIQSGPSVMPAIFVAQAIDAGLDATVISLVGLGKTEMELLALVKESLQTANKPLADALTLEAFRAVLRYIAATRKNIALSAAIPELLDADGPTAIWPVHYNDAGGERVEVGTPIEEQAHRAEFVGFHVLINGGLYHSGSLPADTTANLVIPVALLPGEHTLRMCYVNADRDTTRLSPPATFTVA